MSDHSSQYLFIHKLYIHTYFRDNVVSCLPRLIIQASHGGIALPSIHYFCNLLLSLISLPCKVVIVGETQVFEPGKTVEISICFCQNSVSDEQDSCKPGNRLIRFQIQNTHVLYRVEGPNLHYIFDNHRY